MKNFKFLLAGVLVFLMSAVSVFAYDGHIALCRELGNVTYNEFVDSFENNCEKTTKEFLMNNYTDSLSKLFLIDSNKIDNEDNELLGDLEYYLENEEKATVNTVYQTMVMRNRTEDVIDGWVVYSQFTEKNGWGHYMVYFAY